MCVRVYVSVSVCLCVCLSVNRFSREPCLLWVLNVEVWTSTMGALTARNWSGVGSRKAFSGG